MLEDEIILEIVIITTNMSVFIKETNTLTKF